MEVKQHEVKKLVNRAKHKLSGFTCGSQSVRVGYFASLSHWLSDVLYTYSSFLLAVGVAFVVVGFWCYFSFALSLPNPFRSVLIWGLLLALMVVAPER